MLDRDPGSLLPRKLRMMHSPVMMTAAKRKPGEEREEEEVSGADTRELSQKWSRIS